jgi:hypothetical protein
MNGQRLLLITVLVAVGWSVYWTFNTFAVDEKTQMLRVQQDFVTALEERDWGEVDAWICNDYADDWGQGPAEVKQTMRRVLAGFYVLGIEPTVTHSIAAHGLGFVKTKLLVEGSGAGLSNTVVAESKRLKEPWVFHWHKRGRWPWSWELVQMANPQFMGYKTPEDGLLE